MKQLKRYWFRFEALSGPTPLNLGCGVTAFDYDDAVSLLHERVFTGRELPGITQCIEDVDMSTLDARHVSPNMGTVIERGVWFPLGYAV